MKTKAHVLNGNDTVLFVLFFFLAFLFVGMVASTESLSEVVDVFFYESKF